MFSSVMPFRVPGFGGGKASGSRPIDIESVTIHEVETTRKEEARTLKRLLNLNHANFSIIYNELRFHNHMPHVLGSAYILGATSDQLQKIYDVESESLDPWKASPNEIPTDDWRKYLGKREYQRAYIDFFEDELDARKHDWKSLLDHYLYDGDKPLIHSMACGLGHCVIHLGYAYELNSAPVAIEALGLTTCFYDTNLTKYADESKYTRPGPYKTKSVVEIFERIREDKRLDSTSAEHDLQSEGDVLKFHEDVVLDHWNAWDLSNPTEQLKNLQEAVTAVFVATERDPKSKDYNFFLCHALTTSHALRILLPLIRPDYQISLARQWLFFTIVVYIWKDRPKFDLDVINKYPLGDKGWDYVVDQALTSEHAQDAHYVKANRALKVAAETWGDKDNYYLKAAAQFAELFSGWGG